MARIAGVDIPNEKRVVISLTYIYGIGYTTATKILKAADVAIKIAHSAAIDSLNVSVATAIMLYYFDAISK